MKKSVKRIKAEDWAKELKRANGIERAIRIATTIVNSTKPEQRGYLPKGVIFYPKNKRNQETLDEKRLNYQHNYWQNVLGNLKKMV